MTTITSIEEKIKDIEAKAAKQVEQLKAKQEKIEQRKLDALMKSDRASETRRKILAGSLIIKIMDKDEAEKTRFMNKLDKHLTRTDDRALFNLKPLPEKTATPKESDLEPLQKTNQENEPTKTETPKN